MPLRSSRQRRIVGVMIDGDLLRGVELRRRFRRPRATAAAEVQLPTMSASSDITVETLAQGLRDLWAAGGFRTKNLALGVNGRNATIRPMTVPRAAAHDIDGYVRYQLAHYLSYDLEDAIIDHQVVADDGGETAVEVIAIGVPAALVEQTAASVAEAGLTLASVDAAPTALATTVEPLSSDADGGDAVVSVDGTRTTVILRSGGRPRMVRVLAEGGGDRSAQLADELEGMIARVEGHQADGTAVPTPDGQARRFAEAADAVAAAINYDLREHTGTGVDHVIVTGAFGRHHSLHNLIATAAGTPVAAAVSPPWWPQTPDLGQDDFDHYVEAAGLAYSHLDRRHDSFDLMPPTVHRTRDDHREVTIGIGVAGAALAASMVAVLPYRSAAHDAEDDADRIEADVAAFSAQVAGLALIGELDQTRLDQIDSIASALHDDLWWGRILDSIATATGDDTFLTSMELVRPVGRDDEQALVTFTGVSLDQGAVGVWLDNMSGLGIFADVWLVQSNSSSLTDNEEATVAFVAHARLTFAARGPRTTDPATWLGPVDIGVENETASDTPATTLAATSTEATP